MTDQPKTEILPAAGGHGTDDKGRRKAGPMQLMADEIKGRLASFEAVQTRYLTAERMVKLAQVALAKNPDLAFCTTVSVLDCLMTCTRLGLEPGEAGGVWLVPFKKQCTAIIDYRGLIDVCRRSGQVAAVHADIRHEHDEFEYWIDTAGPTLVHLKHKPKEGDRGKPVGAFFVAKLKSGECQAVYLSQKEVEQFRDRSRAYTSGGNTPWKTDPMAMWKKTVIRRGVNLLPKTPELQVLWQQLAQEERDDDVDIVTELPEGSADAISRMLADIGAKDKALSDAIGAAFKDLHVGPARCLMLLTKYEAKPQELLTVLQAERDEPPAVVDVPAQPKAEEQPAASAPTKAEEVFKAATTAAAAPKKKTAKKKGAKPDTKPAAGGTNQVAGETKQPAAETKPAEPKTLPPGSTF